MDDVVYSPVHGRLAGLHMHAMALDNLLNYKEDYPEAGEFGHSKAATWFSLFVVTALSLIMTFFRWYQDGRPDVKNKTSSAVDAKQKWHDYWGISNFFQWILSWTKKVLLSVLMLSIMAWLGLEFFHLGPLSWMEYAAAPVVMHLLHFGENMTEYIYPKFLDARKKCGTYFEK